MSDVHILHYSTIETVMQKLNEKLLSNGKGLLIEATVNHKNEVVDIEIVPVEVALQRGLKPATLIPKGKKKS